MKPDPEEQPCEMELQGAPARKTNLWGQVVGGEEGAEDSRELPVGPSQRWITETLARTQTRAQAVSPRMPPVLGPRTLTDKAT